MYGHQSKTDKFCQAKTDRFCPSKTDKFYQSNPSMFTIKTIIVKPVVLILKWIMAYQRKQELC